MSTVTSVMRSDATEEPSSPEWVLLGDPQVAQPEFPEISSAAGFSAKALEQSFSIGYVAPSARSVLEDWDSADFEFCGNHSTGDHPQIL
jgi:hypothetical protein